LSDEPEKTKVAESRTSAASSGRARRFSPVWLVPVVAGFMGLWMVYAHYVSLGPIIEVHFDEVPGIEANSSKVRLKNVKIGEVLDMHLTEGAERVAVQIRIDKDAADLLRRDTRFWIVRPRVGLGGVSGLSTVLSGSYIEMAPGNATSTARVFEGLDKPPITPPGTPGLHVTLESDVDRALNEGDPVLFDGRPVGRIEVVEFDTDRRVTTYSAFIEEPYDRLITTNTQFWISSAVSAEISADGVRVEVDNLAALVAGGVAFDVPAGQPLGQRIRERGFFRIHARESDIYERPYDFAIPYMILFEESIRGLRPGADVEYRGIKVGKVLRTDINYDEVQALLGEKLLMPVLVEIVPSYIGYDDTEADRDVAEASIDKMIARGLHGVLASGNLVTGQKYVEMQFVEHEPHDIDSFAGYNVIPSEAGPIGRILDSVALTLENINQLPVSDTIDSAKEALASLSSTLEKLQTVLDDESSRAVTRNLNAALIQFRELAASLSEGSETNEDLRQALQALQRTLDEFEPALRNLRRKSDSLIFGFPAEDDPEPGETN